MRVPLKEIVDFKKESVTPDKIVDSTSYVGLEHVFSDGRISFIQVNNGDLASNKFKFTENHILYGKLRPYLRKIALPSFAGICSTDIVPLLPLKDKVVTEYLYHFLRSPDMVKLATERCSGANLPRISPKEIAEFKIPLPPLDQQRKIASILDTADAYRQKTKALILKYDELTQSLFLDMFGDPVANNKRWNVDKLKDLSIKIGSGNTPKGGKKVYVEQGITFFRSMNVWKNNIVYDDIAYIDEVTHSKMPKSSLKHKDILMTKTGRVNTENSSLGRAALYLGEDDQANVNGHVYLIRLKEGVLHEFVLHILTSKEYRDLIRRVCVGGIDKRQLNKDHIEDFPIIAPPLKLQKKFVENLKTIQEHKESLQSSLEKAEDLFNSLLQKAFKGELTA